MSRSGHRHEQRSHLSWRVLVAATAVCISVGAVETPATSAPARPEQPRPGREDQVVAEGLEEIAEAAPRPTRPVRFVAVLDQRGRPAVSAREVRSVDQARAFLAERAAVGELVAFERDVPVTIATDDPLRDQQWALDATSFETAWGRSDGSGAVVAVLDTGIHAAHPDLVGKVIGGASYVGGDPLVDTHGHGTHVAGTIGALTDNATGIAAAAPGVSLRSYQVLTPVGTGLMSDVARATVDAVDDGADVVNLSLVSSSPSSAMQLAVFYASSVEVVVVAAAGNTGNTGNAPQWPAAEPDVLAVAAVDSSGGRAGFSTSNAYVDVAAPGAGILSTYPPEAFASMSGTSMAAPHVSAAAAIVLAQTPGLSDETVRGRLERTADPVGAAPNPDVGWGVIDPAEAVGASPVTGLLRVETSPAVPAQILVDGVVRDTWGVWVPLGPGTHEVSFTDVEGYATAPTRTVTVEAGGLVQTVGVFEPLAGLRVRTGPGDGVPGTISVDGHWRNDWGVWTFLPPGQHDVCFGAVAGWRPPDCQSVGIEAGATTELLGTYVEEPGAEGTPADGWLRVTTSPPVPAQVLVDGVPRDSWGAWVRVPAGAYRVGFSDVAGHDTPPEVVVTVASGETTTLEGRFESRGWLRVRTATAGGDGVPATIVVDGVARAEWGLWTDLAPGTHEVCFGIVPGLEEPACETAAVSAGATTEIVGTYAVPGA